MPNYQPLFLKYRPQALSDLIGQEYVVRTLSNAVLHDRIFHAYLFTGPRGTGKTSSARILAKSLNCAQGPTVAPCQTCTSCEEIKQGISAAVLEIDAASNNSVDDARLLIERAPLVAQGGRYKIYIIDECHMLTKEAFNALLKTIEEPPPNVVFILATTEEQKVPPTITSRCQRLMFRLVKQENLAPYLTEIATTEELAIAPEAIELIARRSGGGLRDALSLLDQASLLSAPGEPVNIADLLLLSGALNEEILSTIGESILAGKGEITLNLLHQLFEEGREPHLIASELAKHFLNLIKASYIDGPTDPKAGKLISGSPTYIERLVSSAGRAEPAELSQIIERLDHLEQSCKRSSEPSISLEIGILSLCHRLEITNLLSLNERLARLENTMLDGTQPEREKIRDIAEPPAKATSPQTEKSTSHSDKKNAEPNTGSSSLMLEHVSEENRTDEIAVASVIIENIDKEIEMTAPAAQKHFASNDEMETLWSELLEELQRRNIPTFSLVSTHAFPLSLTQSDLSIGVLVEHFQKMIEAKLDHIKTALHAVRGQPLAVKIRIAPTESGKPAIKQNKPKGLEHSGQATAASSDNLIVDTDATKQSFASSSAQDVASVRGNQASHPAPEPVVLADSSSRITLEKSPAHLIKEAYRLFEGPGSRLITSH
jgi:DNA polymerase-3 subunit gamma/tau